MLPSTVHNKSDIVDPSSTTSVDGCANIDKPTPLDSGAPSVVVKTEVTSSHHVGEVSINDGQKSQSHITPVENESNISTSSQNDASNLNTTQAVNATANCSQSFENSGNGQEIATSSNVQYDWEPPSFPSNDISHAQTGPRPTSTGGNPAEASQGGVHPVVGEKTWPNKYINEIKKRKFDKKAKRKLFVGGLIFEATRTFLEEQFERFGELEDACVVTERGTGKSRGFGYVTFVNQEDAAKAMKAADGLRINGRTLCVEFADDPKSEPSPRPPRYRSRSPPPGRYPYHGPPRGRGYLPPRSKYEIGRYPERDPYYDDYPSDSDPYYSRRRSDPYYSPMDYVGPPPTRDYDRSPRDYGRPPTQDYGRPPPRDYGRPPPQDYGRPPPQDYGRPPPRDYGRPPPRDYDYRSPGRRYERSPPPPRGYENYRRPPPPYDDPPPIKQASIRDVDYARLRVDREKVRHATVDNRRMPSREVGRRKNKSSSSSSSSSSDSSDNSDDEKSKGTKTRKASAFPRAYMT